MIPKQLIHLTFGSLLVLLGLLSACNTTPTVAPTPTYVSDNKQWTPVIQKFGDVEMVKVPAGCFQMGIDDARRFEKPVTKVCLGSFWIDKNDVTNAQYGSEGAFKGPNRPRENLTWFEARDFCKKRDARLPSEAEWEYAARGPANLIYPWGNDFNPDNLIYDKMMDANASYASADVGSKPVGVSWVGALDMSGNVFQWVNSIYKPYPYSASDGREDESDQTAKRVYRGGWQSYIQYGTSPVLRFNTKPDDRDWHIGFRCARSN